MISLSIATLLSMILFAKGLCRGCPRTAGTGALLATLSIAATVGIGA